MPRFGFKAYNGTGGLQLGEIDADNERAALDLLAGRGLFALEIVAREGPGRTQSVWWQRQLFSSGELPLASQAMLAREIATLVKAGITIDEALGIIELQPRIGGAMRRLAAAVRSDVSSGSSLSQALASREGAVSEQFWMLVRAGETSGTLAQVMGEIASSLDEAVRMRKQLLTAMLYPSVLLAASAITVAVIATVMIPAILPLFRDAGVDPPYLVSVLAGLQQGLADYWPSLLAGLAALSASWIWGRRNEQIAHAIDRAALRIPLVGGLIQRGSTARFARTLGMLLSNGVPLLDALRVTAGVLPNRAFRGAILRAEADVNRGGALGATLSNGELLPPLAMRLIGLGEQSGQLATMLARVADIYEHDVRQQIERIVTVAVPAITVAIGGLVGFLMLTVISAMLHLNEAVLR